MKFMFQTYALQTFLLMCTAHTLMGQDIMIYKNGDESLTRILEVTPTEIRYKRFDNPEGPVYTVRKIDVFMIKYENGTKDIFSDAEKAVPRSVPMMDVYFLRQTPSVSGVIGYEIFCDSRSICKLNNNKYTVYRVPEGKHSFSVQFFGRTSKAKAEKLFIDIREGNTYYIEVAQNSKVLEPDVFCRALSELEGQELLQNLSRDTDCY